MPHQIEVAPRAERDLKALPSRVLRRVMIQIDALAEDPRPRGCRKLNDTLYRIRVGTYRVIYEVDDANEVVTIARVRHRREAYRSN